MDNNIEEKDEKNGCNCNCSWSFKRFSDKVLALLENGMYRLGLVIGSYPWIFIIAAFFASLLFAVGMLRFNFETNFKKLWVPLDSDTGDNLAWIGANFPTTTRAAELIVTSHNVLTPAVLHAMLDLHLSVEAINASGSDWDTYCFRINEVCFSRSLLELWSFDRETIANLSEENILSKINEGNLTSPVYYTNIDIESILGGIVRNESGNILKATAASLVYFLEDNDGTMRVKDIEEKIIEIGNSGSQDFDGTYVFTQISYNTESQEALMNDIPIATTAFIPILFYLIFMLGKFNRLENKVYLSFAGIFCVALSLISSFGLCSAMGLDYGALHSMIVFIILGIGVDDMFVIVQTYENISKEQPDRNLKEKIGHTLKHAGVSITVTSLTDAVSFCVGAASTLPAICSFSLYCGIAVLFLFIYNITFFVAFLVVDARRVQARRDALLFCIRYGADYEPHQCSQKNYLQTFFAKIYAPILLKLPTKIIIIFITLAFFGLGCYGTYEILNLNDGSDLSKFIPSDSYLSLYYDAKEEYFPVEDGETVVLYHGGVDYYNEYSTVDKLYSDLYNSQYVTAGTINSWFDAFREWIATEKSEDTFLGDDDLPTSELVFYTWLQEFLLTSVGMTYADDLKLYSDGLGIYASRVQFSLTMLSNIDEQIAAMDSVKDVAKSAGFRLENASFVHSSVFLHWDADKTVKEGVFRNLGVLSATVFVVILFLIVNLWGSFFVFVCVLLTLVDLMGLMYFWGLSIDTVTSGVLNLAVGLSVDYSVHVALSFMKVSGKTKTERTEKALSSIAPAVFNAGFSSILALLPLVSTTSYVFITVFRVVFFMTTLGLFHGIVFLPVLLSWFGPSSYYADDQVEELSIKPVNEKNQQFGGEVNPNFVDIPPSLPIKNDYQIIHKVPFPNDIYVPGAIQPKISD